MTISKELPNMTVTHNLLWNSQSVFLVTEIYIFANGEGLTRSKGLSLNPLYIDWLQNNKNNLKRLFELRDWFVSPDHSNGEKYFNELFQAIYNHETP